MNKAVVKNTKKNQETLEMATMLGTGMNYRQIGDAHGVSSSAVGQRFRRTGIAAVPSESKAAQIDVEKLVYLYESEMLSLVRIAEIFKVSDSLIRKALKLYRIPKRRRPSPGGKHIDRLRKLKIGETIKIKSPVKYPRLVLMDSAHRLGIKVIVELVAAGLLRVTRIDLSEDRKTLALAGIDRKLLGQLYGTRTMKISEIAVEMNLSVKQIRQALKAFKIPERPRIWGYGRYTSVLSKMGIGDTTELECTSKRPHINLHTIANRIGIKISMRKIAGDAFKLRRIG